MQYTDSAVRDPIFWVHHSFVDKLLTSWLLSAAPKIDWGQKDLLSRTKLKKRWNEERPTFPVLCGAELVWYQPNFDEVDLVDVTRIQKKPKDYKSVVEHSNLKFRYDNLVLPVKAPSGLPDLALLVASISDNSKTHLVDVNSTKSGATKRSISVRPSSDSEKFLVGRRALKIDVVLRVGARARRVYKAVIDNRSKGQLSKFPMSRSVLMGFKNARFAADGDPDDQPQTFVVLARGGPNKIGGSHDQTPWQFVSLVAPFALPHGFPDSTHQHAGSKSFSDDIETQWFDVSEAVFASIAATPPDVPTANNIRLEIAVIPAVVEDEGTGGGGMVRLVPKEAVPSLEFDAIIFAAR